MPGVSRQVVSKWELGEGYPKVDKLLILSKKLNVSIDSLLGTENKAAISDNGKTADTIRSISPHEGVIISVSGVTRSQLLKGGKRSPKYALYAPGRNDKPFIDAQNTFPAWYRDLDDVTRERSLKYRRR